MNLSRNVKISSCQTRDNETEIESSSDGSITEEQSTTKEEMTLKNLIAARCIVKVEIRKVKHKCSMSTASFDTARRSVETIEGDPIRYALASDTQQRSALAPERVSLACRPNIVSAKLFSGSFPRVGPSVYRVGSPLSPRARWQAAKGRKFTSCLLRSGRHAPERGRFCRKSRLFVGRCRCTLSHGSTGMQTVQIRMR